MDGMIAKNNRTMERVFFLDVLKFIAILAMAIIHTGNMIVGFGVAAPCMDVEQVNLISNIIYHIAPTIFMFAMGASINLTKNNTPREFMTRGIKALLLSLIFNALRGLLISVFSIIILEKFTAKDFLFEIVDWTLGNDILMFAGLYFLLFGLISLAKRNRDSVLAITAATLYIVSLFIPYGLETGYYLFDNFLGNFILVGDSYFPVVTWFIIPTIGYIIFKLYLKEKHKNIFMIRLGICASALFGTCLGIIYLTGTYDPRYFLWGEGMFYFDLPTLILTLSLNYVYIPVIYFLSKTIDKARILRTLIVFESKHLTRIYLTHWVVIIISGIIFAFTGFEASSPVFVVLYGIFVAVLSSVLVRLWRRTTGSNSL